MAVPQFPTTNWSIIAMLTDSPDRAQQALEGFCEEYREPLLRYLIAGGLPKEDAEDTLHDFLVRFIAKEGYRNISVEGGKLRNYLMTALKNHAIKKAVHRGATKRGGKAQVVPIDRLASQIHRLDAESAQQAYDRQWATSMMESVMEKLKSQYIERGKQDWYEAALRCFHWDPKAVSSDYQETAESFGVRPSRVALEVFRLRRRFQRLLREEIARTVQTPCDIDEELRYLAHILEHHASGEVASTPHTPRSDEP